MTFGSVCSGIEAASCAWLPLGFRAAWVAEVEPFCCALLKHHYPEVPNHGDFTRIRESEPIDVLVGGTPCQSFSVAGKRAGLDDPRGNLTLEFLALAGRLRPRWVVWENVPGVLSDDGGRTFGTVLGLLGKFGYGFAYRVLDAQYFGVPQRRRRVFVVGHLADWRPAAAVLFERYSLQGHPPPSREKGQGFAHEIASSLTNSGRGVERGGDSRGQDPVVRRIDGESETFITASLDASYGRLQGASGQDANHGHSHLVTHSPRADGFDASEDGTGRGTPLVASAIGQQQTAVRRLTPRECERLQGFPDDYTQIPYRGKPAADGPRYRALGNSMAVPVMEWIGRRILDCANSKADNERKA